MAKKKKGEDFELDKEEEGKKKGKLGTILLVIGIVVIWLGIFGLLIKLDVGGIGSELLRPLIKDVPVLNWILPSVSEEQLVYEGNYPYKDMAEAVEVIKSLEKQIELLQEQVDNVDFDATIAEMQAEIDRLKIFEQTQEEFEQRVKDFDENVVFNSQAPDVEEYRKYYEEINPDTAAEIYRQVIEQQQYDDAILEKAELLRKMKPANAAAVVETMNADTEWICKVLLSMKPEECAAILDKMQTLNVARILKKMQDMDAERLSAIQNRMN